MKLRSVLPLLFVSVFCFIVLSGCGSNTAGTAASGSAASDSASADASAEAKVLNVGLLTIPSMDPHNGYAGWETSRLGITETLYAVDANMSLVTVLAKEIGTLEGNTWTIPLREDITFSNGKEITAQAVVENLKRTQKVNVRANFLEDAIYETPDDHTLKITTTHPEVNLLNQLVEPMFSIVDLSEGEPEEGSVVASGPYVVDAYVPNTSVTLKPSSHYWNGTPKLDQINVKAVSDSAALSFALQSGEIDAFNEPSAETYELLKDNSEFTTWVVPGYRMHFVWVNQNLDANVREAIFYAVDRDAINTLLKGAVTPADTLFSSNDPYADIDVPGHDVAKAQEYLEKAGYKLNSDGLMEKDGKVLTLTLGYYNARSYDKIVTLLDQQFKAAGISLDIHVVEDPDATYMADGSMDLSCYCMISNTIGDPSAFLRNTVGEGGSINPSHYSDAETQKLIDTLYETTDIAERSKLIGQIETRVIDARNILTLDCFNRIIIARAGVENISGDHPVSWTFITVDTDFVRAS